MQNFSAKPAEMLVSLWRNRELVAASIKREVLGRYRGSIFGIFWSFFNPVFMLSVYTFVFSVVFKSRWNSASESKVEFALILFAGMIVFNLFSECLNRAPSLIVNNPNYVKKIIFPLDVLAWVSIGAALFHCIVSLVVWLLAYFVFIGIPHLTVFYFPLVVMPLFFLIMGFSWGLASLGVFLRDVGQFIGILITVLMFLSPIFYPVSALPEHYRFLAYLNPLTPVIELTRDVLYWGKKPSFFVVTMYFFVSCLVAWLGFFWFQKTRKGFADVL